jgi:FemAB-related protein (PEP-CTERM system-associated)
MIQSFPDTNGAWRRIVDECDASGLAHSPEWFSLIQRTYGHAPLYLSTDDGNGRSGVLPAFVVRRPLFGAIVTSMPFLDSGGPCSRSAATRRLLVEHLVAEARRIGAGIVELRCAERLDIPVAAAEHKVNLTLPLTSDPDDLWRHFDKEVRNQIRKAERSGLSIESCGVEHVRPFYDTFLVRMRELGSPAHGMDFLAGVRDAFGDRARMLLIRKGTVTVGGLITVMFKDRVVVPWATCLKEYFALCPNMLLYWEALRTACAGRFRQFDFGRSTRGSGTYRFKRHWGATEEPLFWYRIRVRRDGGVGVPAPESDSQLGSLASAAWRRLPLSVTRHLGPPIRRYLVQ